MGKQIANAVNMHSPQSSNCCFLFYLSTTVARTLPPPFPSDINNISTAQLNQWATFSDISNTLGHVFFDNIKVINDFRCRTT